MNKLNLRQGIIFYGTTWCGDCKRAEAWLNSHNIPFKHVDIDQDRKGQEYVMDVNKGNVVVPTILFADGSILVEPSDQDLIIKLGD